MSLNRRQFEQSEAWQMLKLALERNLAQLEMKLVDEDSTIEIYRAQGAVRILTSLRDDYPRSLPDQIIDGKPEPDVVQQIIRGIPNGR